MSASLAEAMSVPAASKIRLQNISLVLTIGFSITRPSCSIAKCLRHLTIKISQNHLGHLPKLLVPGFSPPDSFPFSGSRARYAQIDLWGVLLDNRHPNNLLLTRVCGTATPSPMNTISFALAGLFSTALLASAANSTLHTFKKIQL